MSEDSSTVSRPDEALALPEGSRQSRSGPGSVAHGDYQAWLAAQCACLPRVSGGVLVLGPADVGPFAPVATWPQGRATDELLIEVADRCLAARAPIALSDAGVAAVACPVWMGESLCGIAALVLKARDEAGLTAALHALQWGSAGVSSLLWQAAGEGDAVLRERLITTLNLLAATLGEASHDDAAAVLAGELAQRLDCDRVSYGVAVDQQVRVLAISHTARFGERMSLVGAIAAAMDEAVDQKAVIVMPAAEDEVLVTRDHAQLARQHGCDALLTVPFSLEGGRAGAFTFERPAARPFDPDTIALCQSVVALCARLLDLRRQNERPLPVRMRDRWQLEVERLKGSGYLGRKLVLGVLAVLLVLGAVVTGEYRVSANATLQGAVRRVLIAPFDGYVETADLRAGERVKTGAVMATLDPRELNLEYLRWASQYEQYSRQYQEAMAAGDRAQSNITLAQVQQAKAQMDLYLEHLARARIVAPFDGLIVSGDLKQSLGSAVKRGQVLFEVAPLNAYRVIMDVDDAEIDALQPGLHGSLMLAALPGQSFPLTVRLITPVTVSKSGRSVFHVEASLDQLSDHLRPGMEGVAKIDTGQRNLVWIWTHRLFDYLRLAWWSWL